VTQHDDATIDLPCSDNPADREILPSLESAAELASILDGYMADLQAGRTPDRRHLCEAHPELAAQLEACLAGIEFIHRATDPATEEPKTLGEFRIIRELGRGGMGVVYEAEQTTLHRHVALKVLRFGAVADEDAMNRFRREAETVARLHHTNIVPIFAVGCERGVHYYAMQYIAGRSLADVLAESQQAGQPVPADDVARWGLQAAEALAHAHQRGVIHRDIKPSNLLLDGDGIVWLTDFGLAKRMDEATLTVHGTLMGTPRYMSPEQAAALQQPVDRRTDVYSLGATLYELATGRALFESAQPHVVIAQILTEEPARRRQVRPALPRDLETVILTCLAKEPLKRYQSAHALASDLRAVLESRPIQARRAPAVERMVRYVRQRRKTLTGASIAAAATVLLMMGALLAWRYYADWRLGRVALTTDGPPLAAEILPASSGDRPIGEPFDIGARTVVALPAGDYRLRVKAKGFMSQTYRVAINRGETITHHVTLDKDHLLGAESIPFSPVIETVMLVPGKADFIEWNGETLIRRDGSTGKPIWDGARPAQPWSPERDPVVALRRLSHFGDEKRPGELVQPAPDLDRDGTGDLVWTIRGTPSFLALSGKDGALLWTYSADPGEAGKPRSADDDRRPGRIVGAPATVEVDGDGTMDLIAEFAVFDDPAALVTKPSQNIGWRTPTQRILTGRRIVVAVSGRSGKELWNYAIDRKLAELPSESFDHGIEYVSQPKRPFVALVDGSKWIGLDPATGRVTTPSLDLGFTPVGPIQFADLDGDGVMEVLALERGKSPGPESLINPTLAAFSTARGKRLWARKLDAWYRPKPAVAVRDWPLAADLDNDGRVEIVVPDHVDNPDTLGPYGWPRYGGIRLLDGATGELRWDCPLWPVMSGPSDGLIHLLAAPDLDADGTRDIVVVSRYSGRRPYEAYPGQLPEPSRIYVDAVSGKGGHRLWHWRIELTNADTTPISAAFWWGLGSDGWPMLALPIGGKQESGGDPDDRFFPPDPPVVHLLGAATGLEEHTVTGLSSPKVADLTADGLADLWGAVDGKLVAIRAEPAEAWRALDGLQEAGDFDGDGMSDLLSNDFEASPIWPIRPVDRQTALARSGRDGRLLWQTQLDTWEKRVHGTGRTMGYRFMALALPGGDLDGDASADFVVSKSVAQPPGKTDDTLPLEALSGRTGERVWSTAMSPTVGARTLAGRWVEGIYAHACSPGGSPDVFLMHHLSLLRPALGPVDSQYRLARLSGRDGRVIWDVLLAEYLGGANRPVGFIHEIADLDGSGDREIVVLLRAKAAIGGTSSPELRVLSLTDGQTRWVHAFDPNVVASPAFAIGNVDGNGRLDVVVSENPPKGASAATEVTALDGQSGKPLWSWRGGETPDGSDKKSALCLADFNGSGRREACVSFFGISHGRRLVILDAKGHERIGRDLESRPVPTLWNADLDGDGRDELLVHEGDRLRAYRADLEELWSWPTREQIRELLPAAPGRPATVVLNPSLGLDGATGRPIWSIGAARSILRVSNDNALPHALTGSDETTVCRAAMPLSADGTYRIAPGVAAKRSAFHNDPRWELPLPWVGPVEPYADPLMHAALAATLINICIPIALLWLATRKRFGSVRLLLALPAVVAFVLTGYSVLSSLNLDRHQPAVYPFLGELARFALVAISILPIVAYATAFVLSLVRTRWLKRLLALPVVIAILWSGYTAAISLIPGNRPSPEPSWWSTPLDVATLSVTGLPIVAYAAVLVLSLLRRRWRTTRSLIAGPVLAAILIAANTFLSDLLSKPRIEHYNWSGWHQLIFWGAYWVGAVVLITWLARAVARSASRLASQLGAAIWRPANADSR
jgi:tRNA A-37 threonylcarbamoyl transferase component Bud32/outer membrane protein assembly factor BamB